MQVSLFDMTFSSIAATANELKNRTVDHFSAGVVNGLTVYTDADHNHVAVSPGVAYDPTGERIYVPSIVSGIGYNNANLNASAASFTLVARYQEVNDGTTGIDPDGICQFRHLIDSYSLLALKTGVDSVAANDVRLSGIQVTIPGGTFIFNQGTRDLSQVLLQLPADFDLPRHAETHLQGGSDAIFSPVLQFTGAGNLSLILSDEVVVINKGTPDVTTVTLPSGVPVGAQFTVKDGKGDASSRPITVVPASGTIDGATNYIMRSDRQAITAMYSGSEYVIL